jgi:hypothetical protein
LITQIIIYEEYKSTGFLLCSLLLSDFNSAFLGPNFFLKTLFSNTLALCSSCNVRDQVSHPCKTAGKILISYILIFVFLDSMTEDEKDSRLNGSWHSLNLICS